MDAKLKDMWLKALRSGEYKQGYQYLGRNGKHCCLGVLCDVAQKNSLIPDGVTIIRRPDGMMACDDLLGSIPGSQFGISENIVTEAWRRNDGLDGFRSQPFSEIADWIETAVSTDQR